MRSFLQGSKNPRSLDLGSVNSLLGFSGLLALLIASLNIDRPGMMQLAQQQYNYKLETKSNTYHLALSPIQAACAQKSGIITLEQLQTAARTVTGTTNSRDVITVAEELRASPPLQKAWRSVQLSKCKATWVGEGNQRILIGRSSARASDVGGLLSMDH